MGRQHQGMDRPGVRQVPEGSGEQWRTGKNGETGSEIICGAPSSLVVKELMMMIMHIFAYVPFFSHSSLNCATFYNLFNE